MNPFWRAYFSKGLVQPPTSEVLKDSRIPHQLIHSEPPFSWAIVAPWGTEWHALHQCTLGRSHHRQRRSCTCARDNWCTGCHCDWLSTLPSATPCLRRTRRRKSSPYPLPTLCDERSSRGSSRRGVGNWHQFGEHNEPHLWLRSIHSLVRWQDCHLHLAQEVLLHPAVEAEAHNVHSFLAAFGKHGSGSDPISEFSTLPTFLSFLELDFSGCWHMCMAVLSNARTSCKPYQFFPGPWH